MSRFVTHIAMFFFLLVPHAKGQAAELDSIASPSLIENQLADYSNMSSVEDSALGSAAQALASSSGSLGIPALTMIENENGGTYFSDAANLGHHDGTDLTALFYHDDDLFLLE